MTDTVQVIYETSGERIRIPMGTSLLELARKVTPGDHPFLAAYVNNRIRELNYRIFSPGAARLPEHLVVPAAAGRGRALSRQAAPHPPLDGAERLLLRD